MTRNLFDVLLVLARFQSPQQAARYSAGFKSVTGHDLSNAIWIDMLCINQDDVSELNSQISIMGRI